AHTGQERMERHASGHLFGLYFPFCLCLGVCLYFHQPLLSLSSNDSSTARADDSQKSPSDSRMFPRRVPAAAPRCFRFFGVDEPAGCLFAVTLPRCVFFFMNDLRFKLSRVLFR